MGPSSSVSAAASGQAPSATIGEAASAYSAEYPGSSAFTLPVRASSTAAPGYGEAANAPAAYSSAMMPVSAEYGGSAQQSGYVPAADASAEPAAGDSLPKRGLACKLA